MSNSLESRMHANVQVRFGGGWLEKGCFLGSTSLAIYPTA